MQRSACRYRGPNCRRRGRNAASDCVIPEPRKLHCSADSLRRVLSRAPQHRRARGGCICLERQAISVASRPLVARRSGLGRWLVPHSLGPRRSWSPATRTRRVDRVSFGTRRSSLCWGPIVSEGIRAKSKSRCGDSNSRPALYESAALPTELHRPAQTRIGHVARIEQAAPVACVWPAVGLPDWFRRRTDGSRTVALAPLLLP